jgi:alpha-D-ribose 1-methylphosphonate 5-triphosphate synthase subunit PhnI
MSAEQRREQLLRVMKTVFAEAKTQGDFTAQKVASASGVSVVLLYRSVGKEFKELRGQLQGPRLDDTTLLNKLKMLVKELRQRVRELEDKLKAKGTEVIRVIELLDEENRMLRSDLRLLRQRLDESEVAIIPIPNGDYRIKRRHFTSPSTTLIDELRRKLH